ncbi:lytic transglycosylase domain-containing protein [bacterium]|nr:lytic transglycosylase domain-containing protein [bacterium]
MHLLALFICLSTLSAFPAPHGSLETQIRDAAARSSLDPLLIKAVIAVESNFKTHATSPKGAMGLMQVMPKTAEAQGIRQPYHPTDNLMGACEYLRTLINRYRGRLELALAAYNAGPSNVDRYQGIPPFPETRAYVKKILNLYERSKRSPQKP